MDPFAHSLFGAALARTPWARRVPAATATLVVAANLPDVDVVAYAFGSDQALAARRGLTHGPIGLIVLTLLWVGVLWWWHDRRGRGSPSISEGSARRSPVVPWLVLTVLGIVSHPMLDWMNTYGVRWLMPFEKRWFYGDVLFIVDPWMWLLLGSAVALGGPLSPRWRRVLGVLAILASVPVLLVAPGWARALWFAGLLATAAVLRYQGRAGGSATHETALVRGPRLAAALVLLFFAYLVTMAVAAQRARSFVAAEANRLGVSFASTLGPSARELMVGPQPVTPFERDVVMRTSDGYRFGRFRWLPRPSLELEAPGPALLGADLDTEPLVAAALVDPCIAGFVNWMRFPFSEVESNGSAGGHTVYLLDARYTRARTNGFGSASSIVPARGAE